MIWAQPQEFLQMDVGISQVFDLRVFQIRQLFEQID